MIFSLFGGEKKRVAELIAASRSGDQETMRRLLAKGANVNAPEPESGDTPLIAAIDKSQWAAVELLLKHSPKLDLQDNNGNTAVYLAVTRGEPALTTVNLLLNAGANTAMGPTKGDNAGSTPLHVACAIGANGCVETLLKHGASVTAKMPTGSLPIHKAAIKGNHRTVELLCKAGADVKALDQVQRTALHDCGMTGNVDVAAAVIRAGADVNQKDKEGCTPLMHAAMNDRAEVMKLFLDNGADPNIIVHTEATPLFPLYVAAMKGFDDVVNLLIGRGASLSVKLPGVPPLADVAKHSGHEGTAKLLAAAVKRQRAAEKAEKDSEDLQKQLAQAWMSLDGDELRKVAESKLFSKLPAEKRLAVLAVNGDLAGVKVLLSSGAKPDVSVESGAGTLPVLVASCLRKGNAEVVRALLDGGANPNELRGDGASALQIASNDGEKEIVRVLLQHGANPSHALPSGQTVLMTATVKGQLKVVEMLIDAGADVNAKIPEGDFGAFAMALDTKMLRIAQMLLNNGAKPDFGTSATLPLVVAEFGSLEFLRQIDALGGSNLRSFGARAAFVAARNKDPEILDYLLNQGIELSSGNDYGYTPLILASVANHTVLVQRYLDRGDDPSARDVDGETALSLAIEKNNFSAIKCLRDANAETKEYVDLSPKDSMLRASVDGALGTILNLKDSGISINCVDEKGNTPLMLAAQSGYVGVVRSLYHLGADLSQRNIEGSSASNLAKNNSHDKVLKTLMEFGAGDALQDVYGINRPDGEEGNRKTIDVADALMGRYSHPFKNQLPYDDSTEDSVESENEIEEETSEETADEIKPLVSDAIAGTLDKLESLLVMPHIIENVSDHDRAAITERILLIRSKGEGALPRAQVEELVEVCSVLASQPEHEELPPPLFIAAAEGDLQQFRKLLKTGENINDTTEEGTTLLMTAAQNGHNSICAELIKLGADVNQRRKDTFSAFLIACFLGHEDVVRTLAKHGADVNAPYEIGSSQGATGNQTALTVAAQRGNLPMCLLLVKLGADINVVSDAGYTPLMWSLVNGASEEVAEFLLKSGAKPDPDAQSKVSISTSTTPLILAATNGMTSVVKALIKKGVGLDKQDGDGWTALKRAANSGHEDVVATLIKAGAQPDVKDVDGWTALINAAGKNNVAICKALLKAGANVNARADSGRTPLIQAVGARSDNAASDALNELRMQLARMMSGDGDEGETKQESPLALIKLLLKAGANPNDVNDGCSLLAGALENDDDDLAALFVKHGAVETPMAEAAVLDLSDPTNELGMVLLAAARDADPKALHEAVLGGADINFSSQEGQSSLVLVFAGLIDESKDRMFRRNAEQCLDFLLTHGASPNIGSPSPFVMAAMRQRLDLVRSMLSAGVNIDQNIGEGQTALFMSLLAPEPGRTPDDRCAVCLVQAGADSSLRHESGAMPIHLAAGSNYIRALQELLNRRPEDVDAKTNIGITPLMMAATEGHLEAVKVLLKFGADRALEDNEGLTAKDVAINNGNEDLVPLLS